MIKEHRDAETAGICILASAVVNPVFGWSMTMLLDNNGLIGDKQRKATLSFKDRVIIPGAAFTICVIAMGLVGMLPGIAAIMN